MTLNRPLETNVSIAFLWHSLQEKNRKIGFKYRDVIDI